MCRQQMNNKESVGTMSNKPIQQQFGLLSFITTIAMLLVVSLSALSPALAASEDGNFCSPSSANVVLLIDITSEFDKRSKLIFQQGISKIIPRLQDGEKLSIFTVQESFTQVQHIFEGCSPFCDPSAGFTSSCTEGKAKLSKRKFRQTIGNALSRTLKSTRDLESSDIVRSLYFATVGFQKQSKPLNLYIFSDLIENSDFMSGRMFFSSKISNILKSIKKNNLLPDFTNSKVRVFGIGRGGTVDRKPLNQKNLNRVRQFWNAYFDAAGAKDIIITEMLVE